MENRKIDMIEPYLDIKLKQQRNELNDDAFALFFECWIINRLDFYHNQLKDLDFLLEAKYRFDIEPPEMFVDLVKKYISLRKNGNTEPINRLYPLYMVPFEMVVPKPIRKSFIYEIQDKITLGWYYKDFMYWLHGYKPEFYNENVGYALSILVAYRNCRFLFKGLSCSCFYFTYSGVKRPDINEFSNTHYNKTYHLNEIIQLRNGVLDPAMYFGGGPGDHFGFQPDVTYKPASASG